MYATLSKASLWLRVAIETNEDMSPEQKEGALSFFATLKDMSETIDPKVFISIIKVVNYLCLQEPSEKFQTTSWPKA